MFSPNLLGKRMSLSRRAERKRFVRHGTEETYGAESREEKRAEQKYQGKERRTGKAALEVKGSQRRLAGGRAGGVTGSSTPYLL